MAQPTPKPQSPRPRVRQTGAARKAQIARAALDLIGQGGIQKLTTAAIARRVGVSEAGLYRHFPGKEQILDAVLDQVLLDMKNRHQALLQAQGAGPVSVPDLLEGFVRQQLAFLHSNRGMPRLLTSADNFLPVAVRDRWHAFVLDRIGFFSGLFARGQAEGSVRPDCDPQALASMVIALFQHCGIKWMMSHFSFDIEAEGLRLWAQLRTLFETGKGKKP